MRIRESLLALRAIVALSAAVATACESPAPRAAQTTGSESTEAKPTEAKPTATKPQRDTASDWLKVVDTSVMDDSRSVRYTKMAEDFSGALTIRCRANTTEVFYSYTGMFKSGGDEPGRTAIRWRLDSAPPVLQYWSESTDYHAAFSFSPVALLRRAATAHRLLIEYEPFGGGAEIAAFQLDGIGPVLQDIAHECRWSRGTHDE